MVEAMRVPVPIEKAWRLFNHGPVTLITASHGGRENVMTAAWVTPLDFDPPKLTVVLSADAHTRSLVEASRELVMQVPTVSMLDVIEGVGGCSGRDVDKWTRFNIGRLREASVTPPLVEGCVAWMAARVIDEPAMAERYDLFIVEGYAAWADDEVYEGARLRDGVPAALRAVHHVTRGVYVFDSDTVRSS